MKNEDGNTKENKDEKLEESIEEKEKEEAKIVEKLEEKEHVEKKIAEFEEKYKRALADYQNLQRRVEEQKREWIMQAGKNILLKLLPALDTLMLAQKHIEDKGLAISIEQFLKILQEEGVTRIKTIGEKFDPHTMEAIGTMEGKQGEVIEEARAGFKLYENVWRSAQVIVGK